MKKNRNIALRITGIILSLTVTTGSLPAGYAAAAEFPDTEENVLYDIFSTAEDPLSDTGMYESDGSFDEEETVFDASGTPYAVAGGNIYFDSATGTITGSDSGVTDVVIPGTISGKQVTAIGSNAFNGRTKLTSVVIPDTVTAIGDNAFTRCSELKSAVLSRNLESIGTTAF